MLAQRIARLCPPLQRCLHAHLSPLPGLLRHFAADNGESSGPIISIDRSGVFNEPTHSRLPMLHKEPETDMARVLKALIQFRGGPITVAEYMSEVLTNTTAGYYMKRDVFGVGGDFITSPEVSQLFGEMVGVWCLLQWQQLGSPERLHLVELGPGRGTLMADLLRGTSTFQAFSAAASVHLVEVSEALRSKQRETLRCSPPTESDASTSGYSGVQVHWHRSLAEVPQDAPALFIAHEFFDALPVHQFQRTERGWCERLVDLAMPDSKQHLRMVLSPGPTPASKLLIPRRLEALPPEQRETVQQLEISPQSISTAEAFAERIGSQGGAALIVDYGKDSPYSASLQAIRQHKFVDLLEQPGNADLSCRVDFSALRQGAAQSGVDVSCHGPIPQAHFLAGLGIEARLDALVASSAPDLQDALIRGYNRLVGGSLQQVPTDNIKTAANDGRHTAAGGDRAQSKGRADGALMSPGVAKDQSAAGGTRGDNDGEASAAFDASVRESLQAGVGAPDANINLDASIEASGADASIEDSAKEVVADVVMPSGEEVAGVDEEGMGYSYRVMAISAAGNPPPLPFPGSGVSFQGDED